MHDIRIFLEENGQLWARAHVGKETIYAVWNTHAELMSELRKGMDFCFQWEMANPKAARLYEFCGDTHESIVCR